MSENWNAWNPNLEDDEDEDSFGKKAEEEDQGLDWGEIFSDSKEEEGSKATDIFSSPEGEGIFGKMIENAEESDVEVEDADPTESAADRPVEGDSSPIISETEAEQMQEQLEGVDGEIEEPATEQDVSDMSAESEQDVQVEADPKDQEIEDVVAEEQDEPPAAESGPPEVDKPVAEQSQGTEDHISAIETEEDIDSELAEAVNEVEESQTETNENNNEVDPTESAADRPVEGDSSPIISETEAEQMQEHFDNSDPETTPAGEPLNPLDEQELSEVSQEAGVAEQEVKENPEDNNEKEAANTATQRITSYRRNPAFIPRGVGFNRMPVGAEAAQASPDIQEASKDAGLSPANETPEQENDMNTEVVPVYAEIDESEDESRQEAIAPMEESEDDIQDSEQENDSIAEEIAAAAALSAAATETIRNTGKETVEENEEEVEDKSPVANQELSSSDTYEESLQTEEEIRPEALDRNDEAEWHDPEAESFDTRQETIGQQPKNQTVVEGYDAESQPGGAVPIADILNNNSRADYLDNKLFPGPYKDPETPGFLESSKEYKSAIMGGVVSAAVIIIITIIFMMYK